MTKKPKHIAISLYQRALLLVALAGLPHIASISLVVQPLHAKAVSEWLPTDPLQGRVPFEEKYCIKCHAIGGAGGRIGPDLAEVQFGGSFLDLASLLWDHIPDMVVEYKNINLPWPRFTDEEVYSLISYMYYLRYLGEPGDVGEGKRLIESKGCLNCHSLGSEGGSDVGPRLDQLNRYASPIYMVQAIWNHGPRMQQKMDEMGIARPKLSGQEIADMNAYIRAVSPWETREKIYLSPGNPNDGSRVFERKGCSACHSVRKKGGKVGPALDEIDLNQSVTEIAGMMWNHGDVMWSTMKHEKITWPTFDGKEMADLIAYLYFLDFIDQPGSVDWGKEVFADKCRLCHAIRGVGGTIGSDVSGKPYLESNLSILRAMINQADKMSETALKTGKLWPMLSGQELRDLFAYLKTLKQEEAGGEE